MKNKKNRLKNEIFEQAIINISKIKKVTARTNKKKISGIILQFLVGLGTLPMAGFLGMWQVSIHLKWDIFHHQRERLFSLRWINSFLFIDIVAVLSKRKSPCLTRERCIPLRRMEYKRYEYMKIYCSINECTLQYTHT